MFKGVSLNVTLSEEQMEHIAALAADKIQYTFGRLKSNDQWYDDRIKQLERQLEKRNELIVNKELLIELLKKKLDEQKAEIESLQTHLKENAH